MTQTASRSSIAQDHDAIFDVLSRGGSYTAAEIAAQAGLPSRSVSQHLRTLRETGQIAQASQYRYRFFRLSSAIGPHTIAPQPAKRTSTDIPRDIRFARSCYGHLAGWLGVTVTRTLVERDLIAPTDDVFDLTAIGKAWLKDRGIEPGGRRATPRRFARPCLDWTEKQPHLAGIVAEALLSYYLAQCWLQRRPEERTLELTAAGKAALEAELGLQLS